MAKVSTEQIILDSEEKRGFKFKYDVNVDKEGIFSTTLPKDIVQLFKEANIDLKQNRLSNLGYLADSTFDGLKNQVKEISIEYLSRELINEKIVLQYIIQTQCSYGLNKEGDVTPNPSKEWTGMGYSDIYDKDYNADNKWREGNIPVNSANTTPFGFQIYIRPFVRSDYKYKSGKIKTEYSRMCYGGQIAENSLKKGYYLRWLDSVPCIDKTGDLPIKEMDYSEIVAEFFVNMIKSICSLNERIKDFLEPEMILKIAESKQKLLG